jgi:hypothetical protein
VHGALGALTDARDQLIAQDLVFGRGASAGQVALRDRVRPEQPDQLCRETGRRRHQATVHDIVYQPVDRLDAVQPFAETGLGHVEQRHASAGRADRLPDRYGR